MTILMTDGAKGSVVIFAGQLRQSAVAVYLILYIARGDWNGVAIDILLAVFQMFTHPPLVWPYQVRARTIVHAMTSIDDE